MNNALKQDFQKLSDKLDKVSTRERLLILTCGLVIIIFLCYSLIIAPLLLKVQDADERIKITETNIATQTKELASIAARLRDDPNKEVNIRIGELHQEIASINARIKEQTKHLVPANQMAALLENVLAETKNLTIMELRSMDPILVLIDENLDTSEQKEAIYRHGVTIILEGSYFNIQKYLETLEALDWKFHWKKFDYVVTEYPKAVVELEMYTLSTNKAFIGV